MGAMTMAILNSRCSNLKKNNREAVHLQVFTLCISLRMYSGSESICIQVLVIWLSVVAKKKQPSFFLFCGCICNLSIGFAVLCSCFDGRGDHEKSE